MRWDNEYNKRVTRFAGDHFKECQKCRFTPSCLLYATGKLPVYVCSNARTAELCSSLRCLEGHKGALHVFHK